MGQEMDYDEYGNLKNASLLDCRPITRSARRASASHPMWGGVSAISNAVNDAFAHLGLTHTAMPHDQWRVWKTAQRLGLTAA
jgi:aerobic carbon-monoxide dehydrogenase large subunit